MKRIKTEYTFRTDRIERPLRFAVCSDLHSDTFDDVLDEFSRCDAVLIPGDLVDRHRRNNENALRFLKTVPEIVPVFYSVGNHERKFRQREAYMQKVAESKAILLDNESMDFHGVRIGGLSSSWDKVPDMAFLDRYETESGYRLLLCHHPEMYRDYVRGRDIDFSICGHAHGGQIRLFGRGLYAPGQGILPKLTEGLHFGRLIVNRGLSNNSIVPRVFNQPEIVYIRPEN